MEIDRWVNCDCWAGYVPRIILDPFMGSGTTALVARQLERHFVGIELKPEYIKIAEHRLLELQRAKDGKRPFQSSDRLTRACIGDSE